MRILSKQLNPIAQLTLLSSVAGNVGIPEIDRLPPDDETRGSVLLTSNLPFSKWEGIFKDPMTTAVAIDRLVHHRIIIELNIPSHRLE